MNTTDTNGPESLWHPTGLVLSDYVDAALARAEDVKVGEHLHVCDSCRSLVSDLRELRRAAASLRPMVPPARVWTGIARVLQASASSATAPVPVRVGRAQSPLHRWGGVAAAALVLVALAGLGVGLRERGAGSGEAGRGLSAQAIDAELRQAEGHYQKAIEGLETIARAGEGVLDPPVAATLQRSLATVDRAIAESRDALREQPDSHQAQASLLESFRAKVALLQDTVDLMDEMRKGKDL